MTSRILKPMFWLSAAASLSGSFGPPAHAAARKPYGGTARQPQLERVVSTDPARIENSLELELARQRHETLWRCPSPDERVPGLALGPPRVSEDGRELMVQLRPDLSFHDGTPVGVDELVAAWERLLKKETGSSHWWLLLPLKGALDFRHGRLTRLTGVEKLNRLSMRLRLEVPMPNFSEALCAVPTAPLPLRSARRGGGSEAHPSGTGPFRLTGEPSGEGLELVAFAAHPQGRPYLDALSWKSFRDPREAGLAFELGALHRLPEPSPSRRSLEPLEVGPILQVAFLVIHRERMASAPEGLRQAVEQSLGRQSLAKYALGEAGRAVDEPLWAADENPPTLARPDSTKARAYFQRFAMQRMGLPAMFELIVRAWRPQERLVAERIQLDLLDAGASLAVVPLDPEEYAQRMVAGRFDFRIEEPLPLVRDVELHMLGLVARAEGEEAAGRLLKDLASLPHGPSRAGMLRERARQPRLLPDWIPLYARGWQAARRGELRDLRSDATGLPDWADAWLAE